MKGRGARMRNPLLGGDVVTLEPGGELLQTEMASGRGFASTRSRVTVVTKASWTPLLSALRPGVTHATRSSAVAKSTIPAAITAAVLSASHGAAPAARTASNRPRVTQTATASAARGRFPAKASDDTLGGARANPVDQLRHPERCRHRPSRRAGDEQLLADIHAIPDTRPAYGNRHGAALLNRGRRASGQAPVSRSRVRRLMRQASLLLQPHTGSRVARELACATPRCPCCRSLSIRQNAVSHSHQRPSRARLGAMPLSGTRPTASTAARMCSTPRSKEYTLRA